MDASSRREITSILVNATVARVARAGRQTSYTKKKKKKRTSTTFFFFFIPTPSLSGNLFILDPRHNFNRDSLFEENLNRSITIVEVVRGITICRVNLRIHYS